MRTCDDSVLSSGGEDLRHSTDALREPHTMYRFIQCSSSFPFLPNVQWSSKTTAREASVPRSGNFEVEIEHRQSLKVSQMRWERRQELELFETNSESLLYYGIVHSSTM